MFMKKVIQENNFKVIKYKFYVLEKHYYGCGVIICDIEKNKILDYLSVISLNPAVYETDLNLNIEKIEKIIYKHKLEKSVLYEFSKKLVSKICENEEKIVSDLLNDKVEFLIETVCNILDVSYAKEKVKFLYKISNYTEPKNVSSIENLNEIIDNFYDKKFFIKTKPVTDLKDGIPAEKIKLKKNVLCLLTDTRELVKYIIKLLYGNEKETIIGKVVEITPKNKNYLEIILSITPFIFTKIILHKLQKIKIV